MTIKELQQRTITATKLTDALSSIAKSNSADDLATFFTSRKIKGKLGEDDACPIAVYLKKTVKCKEVTVNRYGIRINDDDCMVVTCPKVLTKFIADFDNGKYPAITVGGDAAIKKAKEEEGKPDED